MDNNVRDKIILDLKNKFGEIDTTNVDIIRELKRDIEDNLDVFRSDFGDKYLDHKADVIFKRVLYNK